MLPDRPPRIRVDALDHVALLIHHARHSPPAVLDTVIDSIWSQGRSHVFETLSRLATPIACYYMEVGDKPLPEFTFPVGSAERFAYGYVRAIMEGDGYWVGRLREQFSHTHAAEVERALRYMASSAAQCMNLIDEMGEFDAAVSQL